MERQLRLRSALHGAARGRDAGQVERVLGELRQLDALDPWTASVAISAFAHARLRAPAEALLKAQPALRSHPSVANALLFLYAQLDLVPEAEGASQLHPC